MILSTHHENCAARPGPTLCIICQDLILDYESEVIDDDISQALRPIVVTKCGHLFHTECINNWFKNSQGETPELKPCPYCRREMRRDDIRRIFPVNRDMIYYPHDTSYRNSRPDPAICTICDKYILSFDETTEGDGTQSLCPYVATKCGHLFHTGCINVWFGLKQLDDPELKQCHYCRTTMSKYDTKRVFAVCEEPLQSIPK